MGNWTGICALEALPNVITSAKVLLNLRKRPSNSSVGDDKFLVQILH